MIMRITWRAHSEFIRNVAVMMSGKSFAAAIGLLTMPIVARLFVPDDFGIAAVFASIVGITSSVASLRYSAAIVLPEDEREAVHIMSFSYRVMLFVCFLLLALLFVYESSDLQWKTLEILGGWSWSLPFAVFLMSSLQIQDSWLIRNKKFKTFSSSLFALSVGTNGSRIAIGAIAGTSVAGLIGGYFFGLFCRLAVQAGAVRDAIRATFQSMDRCTLEFIAKKYSDFPIFNAPAGLVFALGKRLPVLLFGTMFSPAIAGLYAMADRLCQVPVTIVATSVRGVFLQKAAEIKNSGRNLRKAFLLSVAALSLLGLVPFTVLWIFGKPLAVWVLGPNWAVAGEFMQIIAPWLFFIWVSAPCNSIFVVLRKQKIWLSLTTIMTILRFCAFGIAYFYSATPEWTLQAFVIAGIAGNVCVLGMSLVLVSRPPGTTPPTLRKTNTDSAIGPIEPESY